MAYSQPTTRATGYLVTAANWNELVNNDIALRAEPRYVQMPIFSWSISVSTGDGKWYFTVPSLFNGGVVTSAQATHITAGGGNAATLIQLHNVTDAVDVFSTRLQIDAGETSSTTAASAVVINAANDDLATGDVMRIDVDQTDNTPAPLGLIVTIGLQVPG